MQPKQYQQWKDPVQSQPDLNEDYKQKSLYINNISKFLSKKDLYSYFKSRGYDLAGVKLLNDSNRQANHGFLLFNDRENLLKALEEENHAKLG